MLIPLLTSLLVNGTLTLQRKLVKGDDHMNRDEILSKSQQENKNGDEREQQINLKGEALAKRIGASLCMIIVLLEEILAEQATAGFAAFSVYFAMYAVDYIYNAVVLKKKTSWIGGIVCGCFTVAMLTVLVLLLCGVL